MTDYTVEAKPGTWMPAGLKHSIKATTPGSCCCCC